MLRWLVLLSVVAVLLAGCVSIHSEKSVTRACAASCTETGVTSPAPVASQSK